MEAFHLAGGIIQSLQVCIPRHETLGTRWLPSGCLRLGNFEKE
jgi:hypothetical protein